MLALSVNVVFPEDWRRVRVVLSFLKFILEIHVCKASLSLYSFLVSLFSLLI